MGHGKRKRAQLSQASAPAIHRTARRLKGEEIVTWVRRPGIRSFRYRPNVAGFWIVVLFALFALGASWAMIHWTGLTRLADKVSFVIAVSIGIYSLVSAIVGIRFSIKSYIAVSPDELLIGEGSDAWALPLERLTRDTLRFDRMDAKRYSSSLPIEMDDARLSVHIAGAFSTLREPQGFIAQLLEIMVENDERNEKVAGSAPAVDEGST
jgi:hypothetical protein